MRTLVSLGFNLFATAILLPFALFHHVRRQRSGGFSRRWVR